MDAAQELSRRIAGEVDASPRRRAEYSSDASNYRVLPQAVVFPRSSEDVASTLEFASANGIPITARGGGTSVAGNAVGPGFVVDLSRHFNRLVDIDPDKRTAIVEPGIVLASLQAAAAPHGLRFGPDPSTQSRCTLGGMIGNNACGPRAVAWGRTSDNVVELEVLRSDASPLILGPGTAGFEDFTLAHLAVIRTELGQFERQGSGYGLEHLLPERGADVAKAFVGSEGTLGVVTQATVRLVEIPKATVLVILGYADMAEAAVDVANFAHLGPTAVEGFDSGLIDIVRQHGRTPPELPKGNGWLFVELAGDTFAEAMAVAQQVAAGRTARIVADHAEAVVLWAIRADGAGLAGRINGEPAWPGWEDAAVPQQNLAAYLREFDDLKRSYNASGLTYGHFADGCIHTRLTLPMAKAPKHFRAFMLDAARLVAKHNGSLSGEHGDGRARGELLSILYSPEVLRAFAEFKHLFDPIGLLNPGVMVDPQPLDTDLRRPRRPAGKSAFALSNDRGDLSMAVHRCVGVGKCRADAPGFMCPSFRATRDEKDSTRGRARVLQEVIDGNLSWSSDAVEESLDLCLSCKACATDCPAGIDMATYKSEVLHRRYQRRLRPLSHYSLGRLPAWLTMATRIPRFTNALTRTRTAKRLAGIDPRRTLPKLANKRFTRSGTGEVMLFADSFTRAFAPQVLEAARHVIASTGHSVGVSPESACCALTWVTTGQLTTAKRRLERTVDALWPHVSRGGLIVGVEPSCLAALKSDLPELVDDARARQIAAATRTLAQFLLEQPEWQIPDLQGKRFVAQPHCHQHAVFGFAHDRSLLRRAGATVTEISGCCGLAGNFGMETGHFDVSMAIAANGIGPALATGETLLADGFSCRTQAAQLNAPALTLAEVLYAAMGTGR
ncbi:FAD-binding and (Fe-S)-binding domain-containing protein [Smaragdicoccus niigatensis]|uniref:FAD-binding and (Fe-S)-binding domain-containing protein n=1 Tax=Smaragdicoccus niigatensis TaxID=359359 RepID=UPI00036BFCBA|nr:FAD-binding and (Fe-S)-binding domain-containing protein [Smaragdicoccus niigatensis]